MAPFGEWGLSILDDDLFEDGESYPLFCSLRRECVDCDELGCDFCSHDNEDDDDDWYRRLLESVQGVDTGDQAALTHLFVEYLSNEQAAQLGDVLLSTSAFATVEHLHIVVGGLNVASMTASATTTTMLHHTHATAQQPPPSPPPPSSFTSLLTYCGSAQSGLRSLKLSRGASPFASILHANDGDNLPPLSPSSSSPIEAIPVCDLFLHSLQQHSQLTELSLEHVTCTASALAAYLCSPHTRLQTLQVHLCDIDNDTDNDCATTTGTIAEDTNSGRVQRFECTIAADEYDYDQNGTTTTLDVLLPLLGPAAVGLCSLQVTMSGVAQGSCRQRDNRGTRVVASTATATASPTRLALRAIYTLLLQCRTLHSLELVRFEDDSDNNNGSMLSELTSATGSGAPYSLRHLVLDSCRLDTESTRHLQHALSSSLSRVESLTLTGRTTWKNPQLLAEIVQSVTQSSPTTSALRHLSLDSYHGLDVDYDALFRALTQSSSGNMSPLQQQQQQQQGQPLQRLDLGMFSSRKAVEALIRHLPYMTLLRELSLDLSLAGPISEHHDESISDHHVDGLVAAVRCNRSLLNITCQYPKSWVRRPTSATNLAMQQIGARNALLHHWHAIAAGTHPSPQKFIEKESHAGADPKTSICYAPASINDGWWTLLVAAVDEQLGEDCQRDVVYDILRVMAGQGIFPM